MSKFTKKDEFIPLLSDTFYRESRELLNKAPGMHSKTEKRRFRSLLGTSPGTAVILWNNIGEEIPCNSWPAHLLWVLLFLKPYATGHVNAVIWGVDEKTFRKWSILFVRLISQISVESLFISQGTLGIQITNNLNPFSANLTTNGHIILTF